jgi:hypothetical protein
MLSSQNSGKYFTQKYARNRELCALDKDKFTAAEQDYYEVDTTPHKGRGQAVEDSMKIDTQPVDRLTPVRRKAIDIRTLPQMGGRL